MSEITDDESLIRDLSNLNITELENDSEEWRFLADYPGYQISSMGRLKTPRGYISRATKKTSGYVTVKLIVDSKNVHAAIHRLVAFAFIPNPENKKYVDHKNSIRDDNRVENLSFVNASENNAKRIMNPLSESCFKIPIEQYDENYNLVKTWKSATDVMKELNYASNIRYYIDKDKLYKGFYWRKYVEKILPGEQWAIINYRECEIKISSLGRFVDKRNRISYGTKTDEGYLTYNIRENGKLNVFPVHRLVMYAADPRIDEEKYVVDHINGDKQDNKAINLRFCSQGMNNIYARELKPVFNNSTKGVDQYTLSNVFVQHFNSYKEAAVFHNISVSCISAACRGVQKMAAGHKWKSTGYNNDIKDKL